MTASLECTLGFPAAELLGTNKKTTVCFMLRQSAAGFTLSSLCAESQDRAVPETLHDVFQCYSTTLLLTEICRQLLVVSGEGNVFGDITS